MNRLIVVTLAAALSQFALGCADDRTEIYEPGPAQTADDTSSEKIDIAKLSDSPNLNFPVPAAAPVPVDKIAAHVVDDHIDLINGSKGILNPSTTLPPVIDPASDFHLGYDGMPIDAIDPANLTPEPGLGLGPLLVVDAPPSRGDAQTQPGLDGF